MWLYVESHRWEQVRISKFLVTQLQGARLQWRVNSSLYLEQRVHVDSVISIIKHQVSDSVPSLFCTLFNSYYGHMPLMTNLRYPLFRWGNQNLKEISSFPVTHPVSAGIVNEKSDMSHSNNDFLKLHARLPYKAMLSVPLSVQKGLVVKWLK